MVLVKHLIALTLKCSLLLNGGIGIGHMYSDAFKTGKAAMLDGNVTIGGLMPIYPLDQNGQCNYKTFEGAFGMIRLEAMIFSVKEVSHFLFAPHIHCKCLFLIDMQIDSYDIIWCSMI